MAGRASDRRAEPRERPGVSPRRVVSVAPDDSPASPAELRGLVAEAEGAAERLATRVREAAAAAARPAAAAGQLQERLRLGARMLQAFQAQIDRTERAIEELNHTVAARVQAAVQEATFPLEATSDRLADLERQAAALGQTLETAEVNVAVVAHRAASAAGDLEAKETRLGEASTRAAALGEGLERRLERGEAIAGRLDGLLESATVAAERIEPAQEACRRLEAALERAAPWANLLPAAAGLREGLGRDLTALSGTMRELAEKIEAAVPKKPPAPKRAAGAKTVAKARANTGVKTRAKATARTSAKANSKANASASTVPSAKTSAQSTQARRATRTP